MKKTVRRRAAVAATRSKEVPPTPGERKPLRGHIVSAAELQKLREALKEAQDTLDAIRSGEVDAVVVNGSNGHQIYSLTGAEQPYRIYVEQMQEGAVTVSADALILYCNQRFATMVGLPLERVISSEIRQYIAGDDWAKITAVFSRSEAVKHETRLQRPQRPGDGALPVNLTASRLPLEGQQVMCLVVTDLTAQKLHEELRLGKELAEKASLAKDSFLAALSHELRTPLNPALMVAVALEQDGALPAAARREVAMIRRNIELEARLIDDLLDLTRISHGKLELQNAPLELHAVIARALEICRPEFEAKKHRLVVRLDAQHTRTEGDMVRLQQVIWNLLRNAAKFTPAGGAVSIRTGNDGPDGFWVEVADTGIGFDEATKPKIFLAFEQGGQHITRQFGGLGLGLAISRSITEAHGGVIEAESAGPNQGATFRIRLPLRPIPVVAPVVSAEPVSDASGSGLRILLVEDHRDTRESMTMLLQRSKHEVRAAATADAALDLAARHRFDIVITDLGLPDRSGVELMQQLRERYGLQGIATSGYGMEEDIARGREAGFIHHLTKPISMERLRRLLANFRDETAKPTHRHTGLPPAPAARERGASSSKTGDDAP